MPAAPPFDFDPAKFDEGEAAYARGVSLGQIIKQSNVEGTAKDGEKKVAGLLLGYANGFLAAIRRIDHQMMGGSNS